MRINRRIAAVVASGLAMGVLHQPANAAPRPPLTGSYTATASPDPTNHTLVNQPCKGSEASRYTKKLTVSAAGYLKVYSSHDGDWDLSIENTAGQTLAHSPYDIGAYIGADAVAYTATGAGDVVIVACNIAGGSSAQITYSYTYPEPVIVRPKVCHVVSDPAGDAVLASGAPSDDALDITSVDLVSDKTTVTGVIRLKKVPDPTGPATLAREFFIYFTPPDKVNGFFLQGLFNSNLTANGGVDWWYGTRDFAGNTTTNTNVPAKGIVDLATNEIRISVPVNKLSIVKGQRLEVSGETHQLFSAVTDTTATSVYYAGSPSCVTPGK